jgi:hypothetical protein
VTEKRGLDSFARVPLLFGPSPVHRLERLTEHLGGEVEIWAKREDCNSGLAYGGNKTRKLEYLLSDEQQNSFRKLLIGWLDDSPDWGEEVGRVARQIEIPAGHRIPIVRALLRAAGKASSPSWRGEALREASILAADSKPARDIVSAAVVRMIESGDPANVEAVAIAGVSAGD